MKPLINDRALFAASASRESVEHYLGQARARASAALAEAGWLERLLAAKLSPVDEPAETDPR